MIKKYFLFFFFCFSLFVICNGQSNFKEGYILKKQNDTVYGLVDDRSEIANAQKCRFKRTETSDIEEFEAGKIIAYRFKDSKYYVSREITQNELTKTVFLEYLLNGIVDLYLYTDANGAHFYIQDESGEFRELNDNIDQVVIDNVMYSRHDKEYVGVLNSMFQKAKDLKTDIERTELNRKSLIKISEKYHDAVCTDEKCVIYEKKISNPGVYFSLNIGGNIQELPGREHKLDYFWYKFPDLQIYSPLIGVSIEFKTNYSEQLSIMIDPYLYRTKYSSSYISDLIYDVPFSAEYYNLHTDFNLKYSFLKKKTDPYLFAGFASGIFLFRKDKNIPYLQHYSKNTTFGFTAGGGIDFRINERHSLGLKLTYNRMFQIQKYYTGNIYNLSLVIPLKER